MSCTPYPSDTRAKGWRFEIDHERIRQSDTWALAAPEVRPWLLMLWMVAWEQTPCGSLPSDDALIAARIGMSSKLFSKHKDILMRGWIQADDGRLYHPVLTLRVNEMLAKRMKDAARAANSRAKRSDKNLVADGHKEPDGESLDSHMDVTRDSLVSSTPSTKHQAPDIKPYVKHTIPSLTEVTTSKAGAVCVAIRSEGITSTNPANPDLLALLEVGAEIQEFVEAARIAKDRGKGFGYVLGIVKTQRSDAERNQLTGKGNIHDQRAYTIAELTGANRNKTSGSEIDGYAIKVD